MLALCPALSPAAGLEIGGTWGSLVGNPQNVGGEGDGLRGVFISLQIYKAQSSTKVAQRGVRDLVGGLGKQHVCPTFALAVSRASRTSDPQRREFCLACAS